MRQAAGVVPSQFAQAADAGDAAADDGPATGTGEPEDSSGLDDQAA